MEVLLDGLFVTAGVIFFMAVWRWKSPVDPAIRCPARWHMGPHKNTRCTLVRGHADDHRPGKLNS